jgi:cell division protein FtsI (penicillin-binding protein 3)
MIDEPSAGKHYGAQVAGPIFTAFAAEALKYLGVPPSEPLPAPAPLPVPDPEEPVPDIEILDDSPQPDLITIPDFTGMSVAQALTAARERGLRLEISGTGRAVEQFPPPGRAVKSIACHVTFDPG